MSIIQAITLGAFGGVFSTVAVVLWIHSRQPETDPNAGLGQQIADLRAAFDARNDIEKNLTATDLLTVACGADYMATNGALLCREMFCRLQTNGAGAAQSECEEMANVANSLAAFEACTKHGDYDKCIEYITTRK
jgi:hypothetical protein